MTPAATSEKPITTLDDLFSHNDVLHDNIHVATLIQKHQSSLAQLKRLCSDLLSTEPPVPSHLPYDDLFLLRYILSKPSIEQAERCVRETISYRRDHPEMFIRAAKGVAHPDQQLIRKYVNDGSYKRTRLGEPVIYARAVRGDPKGLVKNVSTEKIIHYFNYQKLVAYMACEETTRATGLLTKYVYIVDMDDLSLLKMSPSLVKCYGASTKFAEVHMPQMLRLTIVLNPPSFFDYMYRLAALVSSKTSMDKVKMCPGSIAANKNPSIKKCPVASKWFDEHDVPDFAGGTDVDHPF